MYSGHDQCPHAPVQGHDQRMAHSISVGHTLHMVGSFESVAICHTLDYDFFIKSQLVSRNQF